MNAIFKIFAIIVVSLVGISALSLMVDLEGQLAHVEEMMNENQDLHAQIQALITKDNASQAEIQRLTARVRQLEQLNQLQAQRIAILEQETERLLNYVSGLQSENQRLGSELVAISHPPTIPDPRAGQQAEQPMNKRINSPLAPSLSELIFIGLLSFGLPSLGVGFYKKFG